MTKAQGIILYGPPGSGKSTITNALTTLDPKIQLYRRLKVGRGRVDGYRMISRSHLDKLRAAGQVLWQNSRYGAIYAVDRGSLDQAFDIGIPVIHLGQPEGVTALLGAYGDGLSVASVWCSRGEAHRRLTERGDTNVNERLMAWDQTSHLTFPHFEIDSESLSAHRSAAALVAWHARIASGAG